MLLALFKKCFNFLSSLEDIFSLLLERENERERGKEREKHQCEREVSTGCLPYTPGPGIVHAWTGDHTRNLVLCSDQELNLQLYGYGMMLQLTEQHRPEPLAHFKEEKI